jgi:uncharacterized protein (UPF0248 family)
MIKNVREAFNASFSTEKYEIFMNELNAVYNHPVKFRVAETPIFLPKEFVTHLKTAGQEILEQVFDPKYLEKTTSMIPPHLNVPREDEKPLFIVIDFAVCQMENGEILPQLIELQGFPSLFAYQHALAGMYKKHFDIPSDFTHVFHHDSPEAYGEFLKKTFLGGHKPENVILLDIDPLNQNTSIDFVATEALSGIKPVCLTKLKKSGRDLYYTENGVNIPVHRIYNRIIWDELQQRTDLKYEFNLTDDLDFEWAGHPNWFMKISKFTVPYLKSKYVPETIFLDQLKSIPEDLENYVLKPLYSFSGAGVIFHVEPHHITEIPDDKKSEFILQKKVHYIPIVKAADEGMVKAEVRLMYIQEPGKEFPTLVSNLSRLSRGEMIGVKFNMNKTFVGGSVCLFEK